MGDKIDSLAHYLNAKLSIFGHIVGKFLFFFSLSTLNVGGGYLFNGTEKKCLSGRHRRGLYSVFPTCIQTLPSPFRMPQRSSGNFENLRIAGWVQLLSYIQGTLLSWQFHQTLRLFVPCTCLGRVLSVLCRYKCPFCISPTPAGGSSLLTIGCTFISARRF